MKQDTSAPAVSHQQVSRFVIEYRFFAVVLLFLTAYAFAIDSPRAILYGLGDIITSRSLLITDYMLVGGVGAMLMNGVLVGALSLAFITALGLRPNGSTIMALWMTVGFSFFGKNVLNMIPLMSGVLLYAKIRRDPIINYSLSALLVATLSPVVSEVVFGFAYSNPLTGIALGALVGVATGFLFPMICAFAVRVHEGYVLYNMGFAGGILSMLITAVFQAFGVTIETAELWGAGNDLEMATLLYILSAALIAAGFVLGKTRNHKDGLLRILKSSGRLVSDYYSLYGETSYINMGILGILITTITLAFGISINGPTLGGVLTIVAFGCFGNHPKNVLPVMTGAILATYANVLDPTAPSNALALLFSAGLAPIAGQFGIFWGIVTGFIHVIIVHHTGYLCNGLNLYNNGFAAGFVALLMVPIIQSLRNLREKK